MAGLTYRNVHIDAIGYALPAEVVSSDDVERALGDLPRALGIPRGQLRAWTGIDERRWWPPAFPVSEGALDAARDALDRAGWRPDELQALLYGGVCREMVEPATACRVAARLGVGTDVWIHDIGNACLGALDGIVEIANRIELGQIRRGMVVSCESAREVVEEMVERLLDAADMETFKAGLATLTGGSGAVAVALSDGSGPPPLEGRRRRLLGGAVKAEPARHDLCRWELSVRDPEPRPTSAPPPRHPRSSASSSAAAAALAPAPKPTPMSTDSIALLRHGVALGAKTWAEFLRVLGWTPDDVDRVVCHQVGAAFRDAILSALDIPPEKDFSTYPFLGNVGTVSLPVTAAIAEERGFLRPGDRVAFLGIGSGLNCLMLGIEW